MSLTYSRVQAGGTSSMGSCTRHVGAPQETVDPAVRKGLKKAIPMILRGSFVFWNLLL